MKNTLNLKGYHDLISNWNSKFVVSGQTFNLELCKSTINYVFSWIILFRYSVLGVRTKVSRTTHLACPVRHGTFSTFILYIFSPGCLIRIWVCLTKTAWSTSSDDTKMKMWSRVYGHNFAWWKSWWRIHVHFVSRTTRFSSWHYYFIIRVTTIDQYKFDRQHILLETKHKDFILLPLSCSQFIQK